MLIRINNIVFECGDGNPTLSSPEVAMHDHESGWHTIEKDGNYRPALQVEINLYEAAQRRIDFHPGDKMDIVAKTPEEALQELQQMDFNGNSLLFVLAYHPFTEAVLDLLPKAVALGLDLDAQNPKGWTVMHFAAKKGDLANLMTLLSLGADPDIENNDGETPLAMALKFNHLLAADFLRSHKLETSLGGTCNEVQSNHQRKRIKI